MSEEEAAFEIKYCKVFPPIGVARVGNSPDEFFIGPEAPGIVPDGGGAFKDKRGRVKRQAARFRVYGFGEAGEVTELTVGHPAVASIEWKVSLANKKAAWYEFGGADLVADILHGTPSEKKRFRNPEVVEPEREKLFIGPVTGVIKGLNAETHRFEADFTAPPSEEKKRVYLGELRTDEAGRLLVLGGLGDSATIWPENPVTNYANNNGWHDDVSDGPVEVEVTSKDGGKMPIRGRSWVIVAPPHFSPHTKNIVTVHDVLAEIAVDHALDWDERELGPRPVATVSFTRDVYPILKRLAEYQWVSARAHRGHAPDKRGDFFGPETIKKLASAQEAKKPGSIHKAIFKRLRTPIIHPPFDTIKKPDACLLDPSSQEAVNQANLTYMPPLSGDEGDVIMGEPKTWLSVTETQCRKLFRWQEGDFIEDWDGALPPPSPFDRIPVPQQPAALTRAALEACQGGAFYPGIEITSIVRFKEFYSEAFRVADSYQPGDITKWMALPWQADFSDCYDHWWPSIRPDDVVPSWQLDEIIKRFPDEAERQHLPSLLQNREPWNRGVGIELPGRPGLPSPRPVQTAKEHFVWCSQVLNRFIARLVRTLPEAEENEFAEAYQTRLGEYLDRMVFENPEFSVPAKQADETFDAYRKRVGAELREFLLPKIALPPTEPDETAETYSARLKTLGEEPLWQDRVAIWEGLFDVAWAWRDVHRVKNDFITKWSRMGFVVPRTEFGQRVLVERDRGRFDLLPFRDCFYYLMNIEDHQEFLPKARELAEEYLSKARDQELDLHGDPDNEQYCFFTYDELAFRARMEKIYDIERRSGDRFDPTQVRDNALFRTPAQVIERIRQLAPFNQLDGSWLERIAKSGPIDHIRSFLFEIWSDEIGNGDPAQNHANVYTTLMQDAGIYLPPINSRAYAAHADLWEASFSSPAYQSAVALFPESYYPELLGMTLYLEWEAVYLPAMVKLYEYFGYNSLFYRLHVAIDNPVNGHGARARDAVVAYLDHVRAESGEEEMQRHWKRVWDGYIAFKWIGSEEWSYRFRHPPGPEEKMLAMIKEKRHYAQLNHGTRRLGPNSINDWFDEPEQFLPLLASSDLVTRGDAPNSRIFDLMAPTGVMYKVFNSRDMAIWAEWINSMPKAPSGGALDSGTAMVILLSKFAARGFAVPEHGHFQLTGKFKDPATSEGLTEVTRPVAWWFQLNQPTNFMRALAEPRNGWIVPGDLQQSRFFTSLLTGSNRMARFLARTIPELGNKSARDIIIQWITENCPIPPETEAALVVPAAPSAPAAARSRRGTPRQSRASVETRNGDEHYAADFARRTAITLSFSPEQRTHLRRQHYGPGGGACH